MDGTQGNEEMTGLDTLIERVRGLTGPDREVDAVVFEFFGGLSWVVPPAYTASLDATASLIERELPGYSWGTQKTISGLGFATITRADSHHNWFHGCCSFCRTATAETPTLALLLAFLTAIKERDA